MSTSPLWDFVFLTREGDHVHLDTGIGGAPPPGSPLWLPKLRDLCEVLKAGVGSWIVTLKIGSMPQVPDNPCLDQLFHMVDQESLYE